MISFEDFKKIDLRVGKIIEAERIEGSKNLLKLKIDLGSETRQILAGIANDYQPEDLIGKNIAVVVNLEPKILFGLESQGMLLAAVDNDQAIVLMPDKDVPAGTPIS